MRVPDYFPTFSCIADRCVDSCCRAGWEIDLDDETYDRYCHVNGELGQRLRTHIDEIEEDGEIFHVCHMQNGTCPFLNEIGLCDIVLALGEEALSVVCTEYPRYYVDFGPVTEVSLSLSCEEAARLLYEKESPVTFTEVEDSPNVQGKIFTDEDEAELVLGTELLFEIRKRVLSILQDRHYPVKQRMAAAYAYAEEVQQLINESREDLSVSDLMENVSDEVWLSENGLGPHTASSFEERRDILDGMVVLGSKWQDQMDGLTGLDDYEKWSALYEKTVDTEGKRALRERVLEHTTVYLVFRYFPRALEDGDVLGKMRFVRFCMNTLRDMAVLHVSRFPVERCGLSEAALTLSDYIDLAGIFSVEVEHAADNVDFLVEELLFANLN